MATANEVNVVEPESCQVLIIGAGLAGLSAAKHLVSHGILDFKIIEARSRVGGRVITIPLGPFTLELGAMWIHGILGNPIYEIALKHRLIKVNLERKSHNVMACTEEGQKVPFVILREVYQMYYYFLKRCEEFFLCNVPPPPHIRSVGQHLENDISKYLGGLPVEERPIRRMLFDHLLTRETCISGCNSMDEIDLAEFGSYTELPGGNLQIDSGFSSVLECLMKELPLECIYKEHTVSKIRWQFRNSSPTTDGDPAFQKRAIVSCANGKVFTADHIIITIPLGVLKEKVNELFEPPLPQYKVDAINRLSFGTINKIFLEYERPFLHPEITEVIVLWDKANSNETPLPEQAANSNLLDSTWSKKIYSFTKVNEVLLLTWVSGVEAVYVETLSAEHIADTCTEILRTFLKDPYVPKPKRVVRTRWYSEVNTRGSYTSIPVGSSQEDVENLAKPIYSIPSDVKPILLFAGEATHKSFYSTTHGALISGTTAAQLLTEKEPSVNLANINEMTEISSWVKGISLS